MSKKINYNMYFFSMIEVIINKKQKTDLGNYELEYLTGFSSINNGDMNYGDGALAVAVRLKNKKTNKIEWGNIYYKVLLKNYEGDKEKLVVRYNELLNWTKEEKLDFIFKPERKLSQKPYLKSSLIKPELSDFFENLKMSSYDYFPTVNLNGKFPKQAFLEFIEIYNGIVNNDTIAKKRIK